MTRTKRCQNGRSPRVFILEDDVELSAIIENVLRSVDSTISLEWATSADQVIARLRQSRAGLTWLPYDLIVADIFLGGKSTGIDCWQLCQELFPDVPVVLTSVLSLDRFFSTIGSGFITPPYLQKPFTASECRQMFMNMLGYCADDRVSL